MALERELKTYEQNRSQLLAKAGKFVLICEEEVVGAWDAYEDALRVAYQRYGVAHDLLDHAAANLASLIEKNWPTDVYTLAICALALDAVDGDNVFEV